MEQIFTAKEFQVYLQNLPKKLRQANGIVQREMAMSLSQMIRNRAPSGQTGSLKHQIKAVNTTRGWSIQGPRHWSYVNAGVAPDKLIPVEFFEAHLGSPGSTAGMKAKISNPKAWVFAGYHDGEGFSDRAHMAFQNNLPQIIERGITKAFLK